MKRSRVLLASAFAVAVLLGSTLGAQATGTVVALNGQHLIGGGGADFDVQNTAQDPAGELCVNVGGYTPANNGAYLAHTDAFDVGLTLGVGGTSFIDSDGNGTKNGSQMTTGPEHIGGLIVTRVDKALPGSPTLRSLIRLKNGTSSKVTRSVVWDSAMGSDGGDIARGSSSGDAVFTKTDRWFVDAEIADPTGDPPVTFVLFGPGGPPVTTSQIIWGPADVSSPTPGCITMQFNVSVPAKSTRYLLFFTDLNPNVGATAVANAQAAYNGMTGSDPHFAGLSSKVRSQILNWKL